ncbi:hypothetical protein EYF80_031470 [Liparis tanakae]|uniref:Uncharacterized protein n=1 Tax=Liparis tanakae TaxID=230148 RepID=A0A4Z2GXN1_9TELE|nr:hypothetical protein EYF80_031470 [Liparis tanakae]
MERRMNRGFGRHDTFLEDSTCFLSGGGRGLGGNGHREDESEKERERSPSHLRRLVYVSTHVFIFASSIPTEVCPSECSSSSSSSSSSSCPGSPERGSSRGTRAVQVEMARSSSSSARYKGTWRAMSRTAETEGMEPVRRSKDRGTDRETDPILHWRLLVGVH